MALTLEDAKFILNEIISPESECSTFSSLKERFGTLITERNYGNKLSSICELITRLLYWNYQEFLPFTSEQIAALYFLWCAFPRESNPFIGFIFDVINIDVYRFPALCKQASASNAYFSSPIRHESDQIIEESLEDFENLHRELIHELEVYEATSPARPLSLDIFTVTDFPDLPWNVKRFFYSLLSGVERPEYLTLTPELLSVRCDRSRKLASFDSQCVLDVIKKQEKVAEDWKLFKFPFCPIFVMEDYFSKREEVQEKLLEMILEDLESRTNEIRPEILRPPPPVKPIEVQEFVFPYPSILDELHLEWNHRMHDKNEGKEEKELRGNLKKAFCTQFYPNQTQQILTKLRTNQDMVDDLDLSPTNFLDLVEKNPTIATEIIVILVSNLGPDSPFTCDAIGKLLTELLNIDLSVQSMEVINGLSLKIELPSDFMHLYISHSIKSCETVKDKLLQSRLARLTCVFLQSLITNKLINPTDISLEVQTFCIEFSNVKEATSLFRMLKQHANNKNSSTDAESTE